MKKLLTTAILIAIYSNLSFSQFVKSNCIVSPSIFISLIHANRDKAKATLSCFSYKGRQTDSKSGCEVFKRNYENEYDILRVWDDGGVVLYTTSFKTHSLYKSNFIHVGFTQMQSFKSGGDTYTIYKCKRNEMCISTSKDAGGTIVYVLSVQ